MADMISRMAAIDALTDTNLKRNLDSVCDGDMNRTRRAAQRVIAQVPTVDAIPMEWLREKIKEHTDEEGWQDYLANSFGLCIEEWQKEQEVR